MERTETAMQKHPLTVNICLIDFHKYPDVGVNEYTKNIARTVKNLRDETEVDIVKTFDNLKIKKQYRQHAYLDISTYDGILLSGSDYNHSHKSTILRQLVRGVVEDAKVQRKHVLGICSGIQLLARAHGHGVRELPQPEAAWYNITLTPLGHKHPFFRGIPQEFPGFSTHSKEVIVNGTFDEWVLASNANCVQAIAFHNEPDCHIVGTQFHPEDTFVTAQGYLEDYEPESKGTPVREDAVPTPTTLYGHVLLRNFLQLIEKQKRAGRGTGA